VWKVDGTGQRLFQAVGFIVNSAEKHLCFTTRELVPSVKSMFYTYLILLWLQHYIDLNEPYTDMNAQWMQGQQSDYLSMMNSPSYGNMVSPTFDDKDHEYVNRWGDLQIWNHIPVLKTFLLPTDAHNVKKHRVIKTF